MSHIDFVFGEYDGRVGFSCPHLDGTSGYYLMTLRDEWCGGEYNFMACARCKSNPTLELQLSQMIRKNKAELDRSIVGARPGDITSQSKQVFSANGMHIEADKPR